MAGAVPGQVARLRAAHDKRRHSVNTLEPVHVGIFDSGVGGLSVLRAVREAMPHASLSYFADAAHAPYGERTDAQIIERSHKLAKHLIDQGAQLLVIACNTATAIAIDSLRAQWPTLPIVGVEPGLKPAVGLSRSGRIGVMATVATLRSARFERLVRAHGGDTFIHRCPCPGLATLIESGDLAHPRLQASLAEHCAAMKALGVDVVVLGCTHYSFVRDHIERLLGPDIAVIDTARAVSNQVVRLAAPTALPTARPAPLRLMTSGDASSVHGFANRWLGLSCQVVAWPSV
jgi:glutamate racemase